MYSREPRPPYAAREVRRVPFTQLQVTDAVATVGAMSANQIELAEAVKAVNYAIDSGSHGSLIAALKNPILKLQIIDAAHDLYKSEFAYVRSSAKKPLGYREIRSGAQFLFNIIRISVAGDDESDEEFWEKIAAPNLHFEALYKSRLRLYRTAVKQESRLREEILRHDQVQAVIDRVNGKQTLIMIMALQRRARGVLARRKFEKLQNEKREAAKQKEVEDRIRHETQVKKLEAERLARQLETTSEDQETEEEDVDIEQFLKSLLAKKGAPSIPNLRRLLHLLDISEQDFAVELEMQKLKEKAVSLTRLNRALQSKIDEADRRIGSLVRNCQIASSKSSLEQLRAQNLDVKKARKTGINEFTREGKSKLVAYQNLFYVLQTRPQYLARLLILVSTGRISQIRKTCLHTLFAYSSAPREAFYLTKMLKFALELEVKHKIHDISDVTKSEPVVVTLAVNYFRDSCLGSLCQSLEPLLMTVIKNRKSNSCDPIVVYRNWISELEMLSGKSSGLPYNVSNEDALGHDEVKSRINENIDALITLANEFIEVLCSQDFVEEMPYGLRRIARYLWEELQKKFPETSTKELLKITAHVLLYRFVIPVICAPDAYNLVPPEQQAITREARSNLAAISKLLQAAASGKSSYNFHSGLEVSDFLQGLQVNIFLRDGYERFKNFFRMAFEVAEPEDFFEMTDFSDEQLLFPPTLQLHLKDIFELHNWLHEYRDKLADGPSDVFVELLAKCGPPPQNLKDLIHPRSDPREASSHSNVLIGEELSQSVVTLSLINSREVRASSDGTSASKTSIRVKQAIVELIKHRDKCSDLNEVFFKDITPLEARAYDVTREMVKNSMSAHVRAQSILFSPFGATLGHLLDFVRLNLKSVACSNFEQITRTLLEEVAFKVTNREKRQFELDKMRDTIVGLKAKREFSEKTMAFYKQYIASCLARFAAKDSKRKSAKNSTLVKYTAKELRDKAILISLTDVPDSHFKSIVFEISAKGDGVFAFRVLYHGLEMDKADIEIQFLLHLQFEAVAVYNLMDKAKINVNLLVYLLNKKFLGAASKSK